MKVIKKEITIDEQTYQPKLQVLLEFDMQYSFARILTSSFDGDTTEYQKDMGYELVKLISETETTTVSTFKWQGPYRDHERKLYE